MIKETIEITNKLGLHARAAAKLSHLANSFNSNIYLTYSGDQVDAKSLLGILTLAASVGNKITIEVTGKDEKKAMEEIVTLFKNKFNEEN
ncbi:MAG: HPr family phosphocarrier protein [Acidobacteria bacterium]|jgi:phosphocarrier protein|nr:HPr family phosphocarrier protein [Acidobacteriota bacterium]